MTTLTGGIPWLPAGGVELRWTDGTHGQMLAPPYIGQIADHIKGHLDRIGV